MHREFSAIFCYIGEDKMINKKHITLFTLCAFTVASLFTNVQAAEKTELSEGMYNWFLVQAYNSACSLNGGKEGLWDNEIEGKAAEEWIEDTAILYGKNIWHLN